MIRILVFSWSQADWGLLQPIVDGLAVCGEFDVRVYPFTAAHREHLLANSDARVTILVPKYEDQLVTEPMSTLAGSVASAIDAELTHYIDADHMIVLGDRLPELAAATVAATYHMTSHHLFAGDRSGTLDDRFRDAITLLVDHAYAFSKEAFMRGSGLAYLTGGKVAVTHVRMPDVALDDSYVRRLLRSPGNEKFVLARLHPDTETGEAVENYIDEIVQFASKTGKRVMWLPPNKDDGWRRISERWKSFKGEHVLELPILPRAQYLAVMNSASQIIGNSSSFVHDAALLNKEAITDLVGERQHHRVPMTARGQCVVEALKENILNASA